MKQKNQIIEDVLLRYQSDLGRDAEKYRNHVYRVFLLCQLFDKSKENIDKYAIAAVFHDLAIWTHHTFDYLQPSINLASAYLLEIAKNEWEDEIAKMIDMHHKRSVYTVNNGLSIETFRKADWIDVSLGVKLFGIKSESYRSIKNEYPTLGFHLFLVKMSLINLFKNPRNPLPMFKK